MAAKVGVDSKLSQTIEVGTKCTANENATGYELLYSNVSELEGLAREAIQERRRKDCEEIIKQLEKGVPLGAQQLETARLFLIGDAEAYVKSGDGRGAGSGDGRNSPEHVGLRQDLGGPLPRRVRTVVQSGVT